MAINRTGVFTEDTVTGSYRYGDGGTGTLTVNEGMTFEMRASDLNREPFFRVGNGAAGNGTVTVTGDHSQIRVLANSNIDEGVAGQVGRNGGTGVLNILAGGRFEIYDPSTAQVDFDFLSAENFQVGRDAGSSGTVNADNGTLAIIGGAPGMQIGRDGATGAVNLSNGSTMLLQSQAPSSDGDGNLQIGRGTGGVGSLTLDASTVTLEANASMAGSSMGFQVGRNGGNGTLSVLNGSTFTVNGGQFGAFANIGRDAGTATVTVNDSELRIDGKTGGAGINVGASGSTATLSILNGGLLALGANQGVGLQIAGNDGGTGTVTVNASELNTHSEENNYTGVGVSGTGTLNIQNGAVASFTSSSFLGMDIGSSDETGTGVGTVTIDDAELTTDGQDNNYTGVGNGGGTGTLNIQNGATASFESAQFVGMEVGSNSGNGTVNVKAASSLTILSRNTDGFADLNIGLYGGTGLFNIDGGTVTVSSAEGAIVRVGTAWELNDDDAGAGTLVVKNNGLLQYVVGADDGSQLYIGGGATSVGDVDVLSGGVIAMDGYASVEIGGRRVGGTGSLTVDGPGSAVTGVNFALVGRNLFDPNVNGGTGSLTLSNGGSFGGTNGETVVSEGGTLFSQGGSISGDLKLQGGTIDARNGAFSALTITGNFNVEGVGNSIFLDFGAGGNDSIIVGGDTTFDGELDLTLNAVGGYKIVAGQQFLLLDSVAGTFSNPGDVFLTVLGQHADFSYFLGRFATAPNDGYLLALNSGASGGAGVLDFGAASATGGELEYDQTAGTGSVSGGQFFYGDAVGVDQVLGTNQSDRFEVFNSTAGQSFRIEGRGGDDELITGAGNDYLDGGAGADYYEAGAGNDTIVADDETGVGDFILAGLGTNTIIGSAVFNNGFRDGHDLSFQDIQSGVTASLVAGTATATGMSTTFTEVHFLYGSGFADTLTGGNATFDGFEGFAGFAGNDTINGGSGTDMVDYRFEVQVGHFDALGDSVRGTQGVDVDLAAQTATDSYGFTDTLIGIEEVRGTSFVDTIRGDAIGNRLAGYAGNDILDGRDGFDIVAYDDEQRDGTTIGVNVNLSTNLATDSFGDTDTLVSIEGAVGTNYVDTLTGNGQGNYLEGRGGDDVLDGKGGVDTMEGGQGSDRYIVDNFSDRVIEHIGEGGDVVVTSTHWTMAAGSEIEFLQTSSTSSTATMRLTGNDFGQTITGNNGVNTLTGNGGVDRLFGNGGVDTLRGGSGDDVLDGGAGDDDMFGGLDDDYMYGGTGNDTMRGDEGVDRMWGGDNDDRIFGNDGNDVLLGEGGDDRLYGGIGEDDLRGGAGVDRMWGEAGNDVYFVEQGDFVYEVVGGGSDTVYASSRFTLAAGSEVEFLRAATPNSTGTLALTGNEFGQAIVGNKGVNEINGRAGNDTLTGGLGNDIFVFDMALNAATNVDTITDFSNATGNNDSFKLDDAIFTGLALGNLALSAFKNLALGTVDGDDRILYDQANGDLFFDQDGSGASFAMIKFAELANNAALTNADFVVV